MIEWISVKDRLPKDAGQYLVCDVNRRSYGITTLWGGFDVLENDDETVFCQATHWAEIKPLPEKDAK